MLEDDSSILSFPQLPKTEGKEHSKLLFWNMIRARSSDEVQRLAVTAEHQQRRLPRRRL
jgi:hypothetical protein